MKLNKTAHYAQRARDIANKTYYCHECKKAFRDKYTLTNHLNGLKHHPERKVKYSCICCDYSTTIKSCLEKHKLSRRHQKKELEYDEVTI